jgi:hypothetical protein
VWDTQGLSDYIDFNIAEARAVAAALARDPARAEPLVRFIQAHEPPMYDGAWLDAQAKDEHVADC